MSQDTNADIIMSETARKSVLNEQQMAMFDGLMLSDAHLEPSNCNARFTMGVKYRNFLQCVCNKLPLWWSEIMPVDHYDERTGKIYERWQLKSHRDVFLTEQRQRWYPDGKKIVPTDIDLSNHSLLWWYIGDGHLSINKNRPDARRINLATMGFEKQYRDFLTNRLNDILGDSVYEEGESIIISKGALCSFVKAVGIESPVPEYEYKFDFGQYLDDDYFSKSYLKRESVVNFGSRMKKANSKPVVCVETGIEYGSATDAAKSISCGISSICYALKHGSPYRGLNWKWVNKLEVVHE